MKGFQNSEKYWNQRFAIGDWESNFGREQSRFFARIAIENLPEWFRHYVNTSQVRICDWGCAEGDGTDILASYFGTKQVQGVDFSEAGIQKAQKYYPELTFKSEDWLKMKVPNHPRYDVVFSSNTLEHFSQPQEVFRTLAAYAKKMVVLLVPFREFERIAEHHYTFLAENIRTVLFSDFVLVNAKVIDTVGFKPNYWNGEQILLIYARTEWISNTGLTLSQIFIDVKLGQILREKEQAMQALSAQLMEKEQAVQALGAELVEKEHALGAELVEKEQAVQALGVELVEKEQTVQVLTTQVEEKKQTVQTLTTLVHEKEQTIQSLTTQVKEKEQTVQTLTTLVQEKENLQNAFWNVSAELDKVYNSNFWKLASFYYTVMKTAPLKYPYRFIKVWREQGLSNSLNKAYNLIRGIKQDSCNIVSLSPHAYLGDSTRLLKSIIDDLNARPLKGLFFVTSAFSFDELYNQRIINLSKFLSEKKYGVIYVAWRWSKTEDILKVGKEVYPNIFQIPVDMFLEADVQLEKVRFSEKYFIVQFPHPDFLLKGLQLKRHNLAMIYEIIDDWEEFNKVGQAPWYNKMFEESTIINSDVVTAVSPPLIEKFSKLRNNINLVPNGFTPILLGANHSNIARRNFRGSEVNLGYFGHLTASWFNWDLILEALELSASHDYKLMFHLIGYGEPDNLQQKIIKYGDRVRLYGKVHPADLHKYVRDWDLGIIPFKSGKLSESVDPIKIYEYMYFGLPVIVSGIKHLSELPLVHFVSNANQLIDVIKKYRKGVFSYEYDLLAKRLPALTWEQRFTDFLEILERREKWISF